MAQICNALPVRHVHHLLLHLAGLWKVATFATMSHLGPSRKSKKVSEYVLKLILLHDYSRVKLVLCFYASGDMHFQYPIIQNLSVSKQAKLPHLFRKV